MSDQLTETEAEHLRMLLMTAEATGTSYVKMETVLLGKLIVASGIGRVPIAEEPQS